MTKPLVRPLSAGVIVAAGLLMQQSVESQVRTTRTRPQTPTAAAAKAWTPPRTSHGDPDLQGVWLDNSATPLERPEALKDKSQLTDDEVAELQSHADRLFRDGYPATRDQPFLAALAKQPDISIIPVGWENPRREFDNRTSLIMDPPDGRIPPLTLEGRERQAAVAAARQRPTGPEDLRLPERCISWGVPRFGAGNPYMSYYQIVQSPGYVVLYLETDIRIIPLNGRPHVASNIRQWNGDSRGRWEGNTLVVDTTNFSGESFREGGQMSMLRAASERLHLVERFSRVAPDRVNYEITLDDPTTWTRSWTVQIRLKLTQDRLYEYACHEGNYQVMRGILGAARMEGR